MHIPKSEYPRPQMVRNTWRNLNGQWEFQFDHGRSGRDWGFQNTEHFNNTIVVPFCVESKLSGIEYKDFIGAVWYRRSFTLSDTDMAMRTLLHFEAVNYFCELWVNGQRIGIHTDGYTPFSFDITHAVHAGDNTITLYVENDVRNPLQPRGKQSEIYQSHGCDYTRCSGIWQTVWLEFVPKTYIENYRCIPDPDNSSVHIQVNFAGASISKTLSVQVSYAGEIVGDANVKCSGSTVNLTVPLSQTHLWEPLAPALYDLRMQVTCSDGTEDEVAGYFGLRSVSWTDNAILINGKPVFQRLVLDQGYYPDGIYTAPTDEDLKKDIILSMEMGFNGARMHEKIFERRYLYWADRLGYMVWGEYGNWGLDVSRTEALKSMLEPWLVAVNRDFNSPALVGWCPFNETWDRNGRKQDNGVIAGIYYATKAIDQTRPVIDTSGAYHVVTDIFDIHDYEQDVEKFRDHYAPMIADGEAYNNYPKRQTYGGQPYFVSEYGGIKWDSDNDIPSWGYGNVPKSVEEFVERYEGLTKVLLDNPRICALCYTQLYDVEQEKNGLYTYDRRKKFSEQINCRLQKAMSAKAAIEE